MPSKTCSTASRKKRTSNPHRQGASRQKLSPFFQGGVPAGGGGHFFPAIAETHPQPPWVKTHRKQQNAEAAFAAAVLTFASLFQILEHQSPKNPIFSSISQGVPLFQKFHIVFLYLYFYTPLPPPLYILLFYKSFLLEKVEQWNNRRF